MYKIRKVVFYLRASRSIVIVKKISNAMPRGLRPDSPGTLRHVMVLAIERNPIFFDDDNILEV